MESSRQILCCNCCLPFDPPLFPHSSAFILAVHPGCVDKEQLRALTDGSGDLGTYGDLAQSISQRRSAPAASGDHRRGLRPAPPLARLEDEEGRSANKTDDFGAAIPGRWVEVKAKPAPRRTQGEKEARAQRDASNEGSAVEEAGAQKWLSSRRPENGQERKEASDGDCADDSCDRVVGEEEWSDESRRRSSWISGDANEEEKRMTRFALAAAALQSAGRTRQRAGKEELIAQLRLSSSSSQLLTSSSSASSATTSHLSMSSSSVPTSPNPVLSRTRGGHVTSTPSAPTFYPLESASDASNIEVNTEDSDCIDDDEDFKSPTRSRAAYDGAITRRRDGRRGVDMGDAANNFSTGARPAMRRSIIFSPTEMGLNNLGLNGARLHLRCKFAQSSLMSKSEVIDSTWQQVLEGSKLRQKTVAKEATILAEIDEEREAMNRSFHRSQECLKSIVARLTHLSEVILYHYVDMQNGEVSHDKLSSLNHQIHDLESLVRLTRAINFDGLNLNNELANVKKEIRLIEKNIEALQELKQQIASVNKEKEELVEQLSRVESTLSSIEAYLSESSVGVASVNDSQYKSLVEPMRESWSVCWNNLNQRLGKAEAEEFIYTISYEAIMSKEEEKDNEDIRFIHTTGSPQIKAASGGRLIERLAYFKYTDLNFQKAFFLTYRYFLSPPEVLEKLAMRYCFTPAYNRNYDELALHIMQNSQSTVQLRVLTALKYWVENYWEDFQGDMIPLFREMLDLALPYKNQKIVSALRESFERRIQGILRNESTSVVRSTNSNMVTARISQSLANASSITFSDLEPVVVAQQLTLLEWDIYQRIEAKEFFKQSWTKSRKDVTSPNIINMIHTFNRISNWVAAEVVMTSDFNQRCNKVKKFILTAMECYKLNNFNGALAVIAGLNNSSVHRLKRTWEQVTGIYMKVYEELMELMANNFAKFRNELRSAAPPCIPYLGIFLTDLTFIEDGNPDQIDGLINFHKLRQVAEKIREVRQYQNDFYNLEVIPQVQNFLRSVKNYNDNEIYEQSLRLETRKLNKFFE